MRVNRYACMHLHTVFEEYALTFWVGSDPNVCFLIQRRRVIGDKKFAHPFMTLFCLKKRHGYSSDHL